MVARIRANRETQTVKVGGQSCAKQALLGKEAVTIEWKWINGYEGYYQVSDSGLVRSVDRVVHAKDGVDYKLRGHIMKQSIRKGNREDGYFVVNLRKNGKGTVFQVHRLVAEAFIPNPENKPYIDHINTIRNDNRIENLRWATREENDHNPITLKNRIGKCGIKIKCLNTGEIFISGSEAGRKLGVDVSEIIKCCKGKRKSAKGYRFEYYEEDS